MKICRQSITRHWNSAFSAITLSLLLLATHHAPAEADVGTESVDNQDYEQVGEDQEVVSYLWQHQFELTDVQSGDQYVLNIFNDKATFYRKGEKPTELLEASRFSKHVETTPTEEPKPSETYLVIRPKDNIDRAHAFTIMRKHAGETTTTYLVELQTGRKYQVNFRAPLKELVAP